MIKPKKNNIDIDALFNTKTNECAISKEQIMTKTIIVDGMMCMHCVANVKKTLEGINGVQSAMVTLEDKKAVVVCEKEIADTVFVKAISDAGYNVVSIN